jgi:hypothetical protein
MDYKIAAAGDEQNQEENSRTKRIEQKQSVSLSYATQVLEYLLIFTRAEMLGPDRTLWIERLSKVPVWKLKRLDEFTSPFINEVWKFFYELRQLPPEMPDYLKKLPEPKSNVGKNCLEYVRKLTSFGKSTAEQEAANHLEQEFVVAMKKKYPHLKWTAGRTANRKVAAGGGE